MRDRRTMHPYARILDRHDFGALIALIGGHMPVELHAI